MPRSAVWRLLTRRPRTLAGLGLMALGGVLLLWALLLTRGDAGAPPVRLSSEPAPGIGAQRDAPAVAAAAAQSPSPVTLLVIPRIGVAAPVTTRSVDADGVMQSPQGAGDVAWYDFSALPHQGTNIVLAGHFDHSDTGPAVFWKLHELVAGDVVQLVLADGRITAYTVVESTAYDIDDAPVAAIVGPTASEQVTLITCDGRFDDAGNTYAQRLVVRAVPA